VRRCSEPITGTATILVDDTGENCIVVVPGANHKLTPGDVEAAEAALAAADVVLLQLEILLETVERSVELARMHGARVVLNPAPAQPLPAALLAQVDVLVPNESETALLTGLPVGSDAELVQAAEALLASGVGNVVMTLGERGARLAQDGAGEHVPAFQAAPVDTTAAGDAFTAGLAVALAEGRELAQAVRWGNAAGALATTRLGAQPSLPGREAVEAMLAHGKVKLLGGLGQSGQALPN
jgi:ribokinase